MRKEILTATTALSCTLNYMPLAQASGHDGNVAVADTTFETTVSGLVVEDEFRFLTAGGITFPVGNSFGVHVEGGVSFGENNGGNNDWAAQIAAVLFTRDPTIGEIGAFVSLIAFEDDLRPTVTMIGAEAEWYATDNHTLFGAAGIQLVDDNGFDNNDSRFFAGIGGSYYVTPNFKATLAGLFNDDAFSVSGGVEYQLQQPLFNIGAATRLFAKAIASENDNATFRFGVNFIFGGSGQSMLYADRNELKHFYGSILTSQGITPLEKFK